VKKTRDPIKNIKKYALEGNLATEEELKVLAGGRRHFSLVLSYVFSGSHQSWILLLDPTYSYSIVLLIADIKYFVFLLSHFIFWLLTGSEQAGEGGGEGGSQFFSPGLGTPPTRTVHSHLCGPRGSASARV